MNITASPATTPGNHEFLLGSGELAQVGATFPVEHDGAQGNADSCIRAATTKSIFAFPGSSRDCHHPSCVVKVVQGVQTRVGNEDDISAAAAVSTGWASEWHEFLPAKRDGPVAAAAGLDVNGALVNEAHGQGRMASLAKRRGRSR